MIRSKLILAGFTFGLLAGTSLWLAGEASAPFTGHGNPEALSSVYQRWKTGYEQRGGSEVLRLGLSYSKAMSTMLTDGRGEVAINLLNGQVRAQVEGLPDGAYDLWMLDSASAAGRTGKTYKIGSFTAQNHQYQLQTVLDRQQLAGLTLDAVALAKVGDDPSKQGLLFGSPGVMQRLYFNERFIPIARVGQVVPSAAKPEVAFSFLLPKVALADASSSSNSQLTNLVARGQRIFTQETFNGNGRTCSTCHRPDHNHTIDPAYIATLPKNDPLFVAEYNRNLAGLEKPALVRQFALFQANADGYSNPPVYRSAPHLLGLSNSLAFERAANGGEFPQDEDYFLQHEPIAQQENRDTQAIGWSQDGAPDGGALRDFAKGAISQHLPKSLNRVAGTDFRLPTSDELDALEAYMLSLGRNQDPNLAAMTFSSPLVQQGLLLFNTKNNPGQTLTNGYPSGGTPTFGTTANCNGCHSNAGAISSTTGGNPTRDTGVERMRNQQHRVFDPSVPYDGGFGQVVQSDCGPDFDQTCYSDGSVDPHNIRPTNHQRLNRFNAPSVIEAADTAPYFHNNTVTTLEETIAFYNTDAFNNSPGAFTTKGVNRQVHLDSSQVVQVALFLRTMNALDNIRSSTLMDQKAMTLSGNDAAETVRLAASDTADAVRVLKEAVTNPYPQATALLQQALELERGQLSGFFFGSGRSQALQQAINLKAQAKALMVSGG
jgi:cytochrome c peroxidase